VLLVHPRHEAREGGILELPACAGSSASELAALSGITRDPYPRWYLKLFCETACSSTWVWYTRPTAVSMRFTK
jgi:hypothetical protein